MSNNFRVLFFAVVLAVVCAALLTGTQYVVQPYREANERAEEVKNILAALEVPIDPNATSDELLSIFDRDIRQRERGDLIFFEYFPNSSQELTGIAFPFTGAGLWGPVSGVLALEPDLITVRGVRFYKQEETPGLGGEISSDWFQNQFMSKRIVAVDDEPGFRINKPGSVGDENSVDGITGATMTSERIGMMLDILAKRIDKER